MNFLTVRENDGKLILAIGGEEREITDLSQMEGIECMCSSSVDFPEDYTNDQAVIDLCQEIRKVR